MRDIPFESLVIRAKEEDRSRSSSLSSCEVKVIDLVKIEDKVGISSTELKMHFTEEPCVNQVGEEGVPEIHYQPHLEGE